MVYSLRKLFASAGLLTVLVLPPAQAVTPDELFEVLQRIESLENEVRYLRGENEQLRFDMEDIKNTQKKTFIRIDDRMDDLFRAVNTRKVSSIAMPAPAPVLPSPAVNVVAVKSEVDKAEAIKVSVEPKKLVAKVDVGLAKQEIAKKQPLRVVKQVPVKLSNPEKQAYDAAFANIRVKPSVAITMLQDFIKRYPTSALAPNARYWLGEAMFASRNYLGAIEEFVEVLEAHGKSVRAPDAAIKLGLSFYELKNWEYARRTLEDVLRTYPKTPAADLAKLKLAKMKQENR
jgi:tol-pal system protein YbgF